MLPLQQGRHRAGADGPAARPAEAGRARPAEADGPPPTPTDVEAEAAAALADEPKSDEPAAAPTTIDFTCPMCGAQLHMPLSEASKRTPCPECKRIIKVPEPEKRDPANWRQGGPEPAVRRPARSGSGAGRGVGVGERRRHGQPRVAAGSRRRPGEKGAGPPEPAHRPLRLWSGAFRRSSPCSRSLAI